MAAVGAALGYPNVFARPTLLIALIAAIGAAGLKLATPMLPPARYLPASIGALMAGVVVYLLLHELPRASRRSLGIGVAFLGFFIGAASAASLAKIAWPAGFGAAWFPAVMLFLAGFGSERFALELSRLENDVDRSEDRPRVIARATQIRDAAEKESRHLDREAKGKPDAMTDPRAIYAYAAQVAAYGHALDGRYPEAIASLGAVPPNWMPGPMAWLMLSNLAFWNLCVGDTVKAQAAIDAADHKDSHPQSRPLFRATKAMVLVCNGKVDEALAIVGESEGDEPDRLRARYSLVRAHVLFAAGRKDAARKEVRLVIDNPDSSDELQRWLPAGGPAKALIEQMMRKARKTAKKSVDDATEEHA